MEQTNIEKHEQEYEQRLIAELKEGSQKAFDEIYRMYSARLFAYCFQFSKTVEDAEEIVQDVFLQLWLYREDIQQTKTLRALLFIMSKNKLINAYRKKVNSVLYEDYVLYNNDFEVIDSSDRLEYMDFVDMLEKEIKKLPDTQQKVIKLSRFNNLSNKEVAQKLELSEQTVKNQLSVGLKALKKHLNKVIEYTLFIVFVNL